MGYLKHLWANWLVAFRSLAMFLFHFFHGLFPCKWTSHEHWGFGVEDHPLFQDTPEQQDREYKMELQMQKDDDDDGYW